MSDKNYVFQHFQPLPNAKGTSSVFPLGAGQIDYTDIKKNIPHFEELAVSVGLGVMKGAILKNTFQFFKAAQAGVKQKPQFPDDLSSTFIVKDAPLKSVGSSIFGTPVYSNLQIKGGSYQDNAGNTIGTFPDIRIDAVIMEINNDNNIVTTDIQGRPNTIIEYIGNKSYNISCTGRILSPARNTYPYNDVKDLITALSSNKSLQVSSWFLNMAGIYNIVIKGKAFPQEEGSMEWQKFSFEAMADTPVILKLKP